MRFTVIFAAAIAAGVTAMPAWGQQAPAGATPEQIEALKAKQEKESQSQTRDVTQTSKAKTFAYADRNTRDRFGGAVPQSWKKVVDETVTGAIGTGEPSGKFSAIISQYAAAYGVPAALADAVVRVESNYRPNARGSAGEVGLMQIKPATARLVGYTGSTKGLYDPETNIKYGMKYLAMAHKLGGGTTCGTVLKYNAGHAATRMNSVSSAYCVKLKRFMTN